MLKEETVRVSASDDKTHLSASPNESVCVSEPVAVLHEETVRVSASDKTHLSASPNESVHVSEDLNFEVRHTHI